MSSIANWSYKSQCTFWSCTFDDYGQPARWRFEYILPCAFEQGGKLVTAADGSQFQLLHTIWFEYLGDFRPRLGWRVAIGAFETVEPVKAVEEVRAITQWDMAMFGEAVNDWKVATGG